MSEQFLTSRQVRERYGGISRATVYRWVRDGKLPQPIRHSPRTPLWRVSDLEAFDAKH